MAKMNYQTIDTLTYIEERINSIKNFPFSANHKHDIINEIIGMITLADTLEIISEECTLTFLAELTIIAKELNEENPSN